ncbi:MAG: zinc ribbon domain-containing protein [Candidatus Lokiarchaeota archaeon]|nr:zinc ribbon domain-containing protein [Candidatus Lokiarchaeota archaeon]
MSQTVAAFQRCPRCGNENSADSFACNFCGFRLKTERIENIRFFRRHEAEWTNPFPWYLKILYLFINPPKAFWDINHKRTKAPGGLILLFSSLLYGLMGLAFISHFTFPGIEAYSPTQFLMNLSFFLSFFIFGICFQAIFFAVLIWLFTKGANYAVGFSQRLETRFGGVKEDRDKYQQADISPFSIYKGGTMLQLEASHKFSMMLCAFSPFLLVNAIKALIVLIGFPPVTVPDFSSTNIAVVLDQIFNSGTWAVLDVIDALTIAIWVPILMTLSIRELSNSSTTRVLISTIIVGVIVAIVFYFLRPTLFG